MFLSEYQPKKWVRSGRANTRLPINILKDFLFLSLVTLFVIFNLIYKNKSQKLLNNYFFIL